MTETSRHHRLVPLIVASPLFLQNLDTSVMATALPAIAGSLHVPVLRLNLAITSYLLSLVVFLPASAWLAQRFGPRRVFCAAILLFSLGSALCGAAGSLGALVAWRLLQGIGGAMMVPVGRLILLRTVPAAQMVAAMVWFTVPPAIGRMVGPLFGGFIVTITSWRWIFLVNIPFGLAGVLLALAFLERDAPVQATSRFDLPGLLLMAAAFGGLLAAMEMVGKGYLPWPAVAAIGLAGCIALYAYLRRSAAQDEPVLDFAILRHPTFRASMVGGMPLRVAVGASPFLLPLLFQLGFGLSPLQSGLITMGTAVGSIATRAVLARTIRRLGFRRVLAGAAGITSVSYAVYGLFTPATAHAAIFAALMVGGLCNAMALVSLSTLGFSEIPPPRAGHATAMASMAQQLSVTLGVVLGAALVSATSLLHGGNPAHLGARDFPPAFFAIGAMTLLSFAAFRRLPESIGEELRAPSQKLSSRA